jgi:dephospho-CoA kinase
MKKKLLIGITGGIGSGKTVVSKMLARRGFKVFYADTIAKSLYLTDKKLVAEIVKVFGKDILNYKGKIILPKLKERIFASKKAYQAINKIVHPVVIKHIKSEARKSKFDVVVIESALLFESGFNKELDYVITVYANERDRINRLMIRDEASKSSIKHLMKFQIDEKKKMEMSDFVIMNNKTLEELKVQADFLSRVIKALAK